MMKLLSMNLENVMIVMTILCIIILYTKRGLPVTLSVDKSIKITKKSNKNLIEQKVKCKYIKIPRISKKKKADTYSYK